MTYCTRLQLKKECKYRSQNCRSPVKELVVARAVSTFFSPNVNTAHIRVRRYYLKHYIWLGSDVTIPDDVSSTRPKASDTNVSVRESQLSEALDPREALDVTKTSKRYWLEH